MRFVAYCRVSTDTQTDGTSLEWQRDQQREWGQRAGWTHVADILDGGQSGARLDRAGVQRTLAHLRDKEIDLVSFYKVDRAARAQRVFEDLWTAIYTLGGKVFVHQKAKVYATLDELMADTVWDRAMAEQERYSIASRTAEGYEQHLANGSFIFTPIYGYFLAKERRDGYRVNTLRVDNERARVVRLITERTLAGVSYNGVAAELNTLGVLSARKREWTGSGIQNVLGRRATYAGLPVTHHRRIRGKQHEVTYRYPPILSEDELRELERAIRLKPRRGGHAAPLRGAVRCARCGGLGLSVRVRQKAGGFSTHALYCAAYRRALEYRREGRAVEFKVCPHAISVKAVADALLHWLAGGGYERALRLLDARVLAYQVGHRSALRDTAKLEQDLEDLEARALRISAEQAPQVLQLYERQITALLEALEPARKTTRAWESRHRRAARAVANLPRAGSVLRSALETQDRAALNRAMLDLSVRVAVDFGEPDRATRYASIRPHLDVLVADEAEGYKGYVVELP